MQIKTTVKRLSPFGFCVTEYCCYRTESKKSEKIKFIDTHDLYVSDRGRVYTPVRIYKTSKTVLWMDCVTGTLFTQTGFNRTTNFRLNIDSLVHDQDAGRLILIKKEGYRIRIADRMTA